MRPVLSVLLLLTPLLGSEQLVDQIAIVVDSSIVKDSDIMRDLRVTEFLNNAPASVTQLLRKTTAAKLIDQVFLREEIRTGGYPQSTEAEVDKQLASMRSNSEDSIANFQERLARYRLTEQELRRQIRWQLTVLNFIDARFRPAAVVDDVAVDQYYREHEAALTKNNPKASAEELRLQTRNILVDEETNRLLFAWLDERRKSAKLTFLEGGLT